MNSIKLTKATIVLACFTVALAIVSSELSAQTLNPTILQQMRTYIAQIRHPDQVDMLPRVRALAPDDAEYYLMAIADDSSQIGAVRMRAYGLLGAFENNLAVRAFLESRVQNPNVNESFRNVALTSYVRAFYPYDAARVTSLVRSVSKTSGAANARSRGVQQHASVLLERINRGAAHPAGERSTTPVRRPGP